MVRRLFSNKCVTLCIFFGTLHVDCSQITMSMFLLKFVSLLLQYINNPFPFFLFKDLIVGDAVIQNPFEWNVVSIFYY